MEKDILCLDGSWEFKELPVTARRLRDIDGNGWFPATVPASIYTCLAEAGIIDTAELTANPEDFSWISEKSWIFRKTFDVNASFLENKNIKLIFEGLDTIAQIWLNDKLIGKTDNMFIPHTFDVTEQLKPSGNVLMIKFLPALQYAEQHVQRYGLLSEHHFGDIRRSYIRKAQYQFGSVIGPSLPGCGIFRQVRLESIHTATIEHLHVRTVDCNQYFADVRVALDLQRVKENAAELYAVIRVTGGGLDMTQQLSFAENQDYHATLIHIERPILWWPRGYGIQHQYHIKAELYQNKSHLDTIEMDFGIRTIRLNRISEGQGSQFEFVVNEQPIQVKGANWLPQSMFPGRCTETEYSLLLQQAAEANVNMLRVWAGGYYEDAVFYQLCDKLGILIWQDFMFAAAYYPDRQWFTAAVRDEVQAVIRKLRNHASLALWCGNSRIDSLHEAGRLGTGRKFYGKAIYHSLIPSLLSELDPDREYIPTTPFSENQSGHNTPHSGTTHNWYVWNQYGDRNAYEATAALCPRFVTEFGLQSLPDIQTVSDFGSQQNLIPGSISLEKHNYQPGGQQRIARYVSDDFSPAPGLNEFIWQSQVTQARAIKQYVEYLRSHRPTNSGCLVWTFNEPAPSIGFSMLDAHHNPKAVYYYAKRFYAPILVTLHPSTYSLEPHFMTVRNDSSYRITATLEARVMDFKGTLLDRTSIPVTLSPFQSSNSFPMPKSFSRTIQPRTSYLHLRLFSEIKTLAENTYFFAPDKYLHYYPGDVNLEIIMVSNHEWRVRLKSKTVVRDVQILAPRPARFNDNFFTLHPDCPKDISIEFDDPAPPVNTPIQLFCANQHY